MSSRGDRPADETETTGVELGRYCVQVCLDRPAARNRDPVDDYLLWFVACRPAAPVATPWSITVKWLTREQIRIDRVASAWLILRFIDPEAQFIFAPGREALARASIEHATPFVVPGAELSRREGKVTFDALLEKYNVLDPSVDRMATIVREADISGRADISPEAPGLRAIITGFFWSDMTDEERLRLQIPLFDALYRYCKGKPRAN